MPDTVNHFSPQSKDHQRDHILRLLREARDHGQGVNKALLLFQHRYTQCAARIFELEKQGYVIEHRSIPGERFVTFFLLSEPEREKSLPAYLPKGPDHLQGSLANSPDWYEREHGQRPSSHPWKKPFSKKRMAEMPLFDLAAPR
jgi:hypothetical protein